MRKRYLDNIRWMTVVAVVIYHIFYMYNSQGIPGVAGKITDLDVPATLPEHIALPGHVTEECQVSLCGLCPNCQEEPV